FVFGGMGLAVYVFGGLAMILLFALPGGALPWPGGVNPLDMLTGSWSAVPSFIPYMIVTTVLNIFISIALIVAGFGLLKIRPWPRWLCIGSGIVSILMTVATKTYMITVANPAMAEFREELARMQGTPYVAGPMLTSVPVATAVFALLYPVGMLII